jgi:hypothetical protein
MSDRDDQVNELQAARRAGHRIFRDWEKIKARYQDRDLADQVPRAIVYIDLGVLCGYIAQLEALIAEHGWHVERFDDSDDDAIIERILRE